MSSLAYNQRRTWQLCHNKLMFNAKPLTYIYAINEIRAGGGGWVQVFIWSCAVHRFRFSTINHNFAVNIESKYEILFKDWRVRVVKIYYSIRYVSDPDICMCQFCSVLLPARWNTTKHNTFCLFRLLLHRSSRICMSVLLDKCPLNCHPPCVCLQ